MDDKIWYEDIVAFVLNKENIAKFLPDKSYTLTENLNASLRFAIYFTILVLVIKRDERVLWFPLIVALITIAIYNNEKKELDAKKELFDKLNIDERRFTQEKFCYKPTKDNPFMNVSLSDINTFPNRPPACNITKKTVKREVASLFDNGLYRDVDDIFNKKASDRQFYTTPITTIPNHQSKFAEWLYKT